MSGNCREWNAGSRRGDRHLGRSITQLALLILALYLDTSLAGGQSAPSLASVRQGLINDLARLPNHICVATFEQSQPAQGTAPLARCALQFDPASLDIEVTNRVRVSVGFAGGKQIFGWPTGESLSEEDLHLLVPGLTNDGDMVSLAIMLLTSNPAMAEIGEQDRCGRRALRYDFSVPLEKSGWVLRLGSETTVVGYHGTLWIDRFSMDPIELVMIADNLPGSTAGASVTRQLTYSRATIGSNRILLPERATVLTTAADGTMTRSDVHFDRCREYKVESVIHFGPQDQFAGSGHPAIASRNRTVALPECFSAELMLQSSIDSNTAAVGDRVSARLKRDIKSKGKVVVPKGALFRGRVTRMELHNGHRLLDISFLYIETDTYWIDITSGRRNLLNLRYPGRIFSGPVSADGPRIYMPGEHRLILVSTAGSASSKQPPR